MDTADLETYQVQLSQVELALSADPTNTELASLRSELKELITLTTLAQSQASSSSGSKSEGRKHAQANGALSAHQWSAGDECLAKYSGDAQWYPAKVISVGGSEEKRMYSIVFRGYNNTEQVEAVSLKPFSNNHASHGANPYGSGGLKRKMTKVEEEEKEKKKKKNEKKLESKAAKAKEQTMKQATWQKFAKKAEKKGINIAGVSGSSIFKTPDNPMGKVGVTGSGKGMTPVSTQAKHKFSVSAGDS